MAKRRLERERGRREATADMSEDLSEGEKGDIVNDNISVHGDNAKMRLPRINSVDAMEVWASQQKGKKLYIVLVRHVHNLAFFLFDTIDFCHDFFIICKLALSSLLSYLANVIVVKQK